MNHFLSSEIRWFYRAEEWDIRPFEEWFSGIPGAIIARQSTRTDFYYRLAGSPHFGIKLRMEAGGKAETKERIRDYGPVCYSPHCEGIVNDWVKWSFSLDEPQVNAISLMSSWLAVEKERWLQMYEVRRTADGDFAVSAAPAGHYPPAGCGLELTRVVAAGEEWFTVGFEAYDADGRRREYLDAAVRFILGGEQPPGLGQVHSMSYYSWLNRVLNVGQEQI